MIRLGSERHQKFGFYSTEIGLALMLCLLTVLVAGCSGGDGVDRIAVQGEVLLDGAPLAEGSITILPAEGQSGPAATTTIEGGRFEFDEVNGPSAGPHRVIVTIVSAVNDGKSAFMKGPQGAPSEAIPLRSKRWEREVDVPQTGSFQYDVRLGSSESVNQ